MRCLAGGPAAETCAHRIKNVFEAENVASASATRSEDLAELRLAARGMERAVGYDTRRLVCAYLHNRNIHLQVVGSSRPLAGKANASGGEVPTAFAAAAPICALPSARPECGGPSS